MSLDHLSAEILSVMSAASGPIGQGALGLELSSRGIEKSTPTIGRRLQRLEFEGLVEKVGVQGRVLTDAGRALLRRSKAAAQLEESGEVLLETLKRGDKQHLLDLLVARRAIEGTAAALAAKHASPETVEKLKALIDEQAEAISSGNLGVEADIMFHNEIARGSRNAVLVSIVALLREHRRYDRAVTSIRTAVGSRLVVDHTRILRAIQEKDPEGAKDAMQQHLSTLIEDITRYWEEPVESHGGAEPREMKAEPEQGGGK